MWAYYIRSIIGLSGSDSYSVCWTTARLPGMANNQSLPMLPLMRCDSVHWVGEYSVCGAMWCLTLIGTTCARQTCSSRPLFIRRVWRASARTQISIDTTRCHHQQQQQQQQLHPFSVTCILEVAYLRYHSFLMENGIEKPLVFRQSSLLL